MKVNLLKKMLELCKGELNLMKNDQAPKAPESVQKKDNLGEAADPKTALFAAIQARGAADGNSSSKLPQVPVSSNNNVKYSPGVKKLEIFLSEADETFSETEMAQNAAIDLCKVSTISTFDFFKETTQTLTDFHLLLSKDLALYCGEDGYERSAPKLLQFLASFASSLEAAVNRYDTMQKKKSGPQKMKGKENQGNVLSSKASSLHKPQAGLYDGNTGSVQNRGAETGRLS